jgi:hypothetical protein
MCLVALMLRRSTTIGSTITFKSFGVTHQQSTSWNHITSIASAQLLLESCETTMMALWLRIESISTSAGVQMLRIVQSFTILRYQRRPLWHWLSSWTNSTSQQVLKTLIYPNRTSLKSSLGSTCLVVILHLKWTQIARVQFLQRTDRLSLKRKFTSVTCRGLQRIRDPLMKTGRCKLGK